MDEAIVLYEETVQVKKNQVTLRLIIPGPVELDYLKNYVHSLSLETDPDNLYFPKDFGVDGEVPTVADLTNDQMRLAHWILSERARWDLVFPMIARKKDGTFAKRRVVTLHRVATSETGYSEDSYGFYGDDLRIETIDDQTAVLCITTTVRKYDEGRWSLDPMTLGQ